MPNIYLSQLPIFDLFSTTRQSFTITCSSTKTCNSNPLDHDLIYNGSHQTTKFHIYFLCNSGHTWKWKVRAYRCITSWQNEKKKWIYSSKWSQVCQLQMFGLNWIPFSISSHSIPIHDITASSTMTLQEYFIPFPKHKTLTWNLSGILVLLAVLL
jgi:hypothetical protein